MPLFKYGAVGPGGEILINGYVKFPLLQVLGISRTGIDGDVYLPVLSVQGLFAAEGNAALPLIRISGKMQDEINGEVAIPLLGVDSEILGSSAISGYVTLYRLSVNVDMQAECDIALPTLRVFGTLQNQGFVTGNAILPRLQVLGEIEQTQYLTGNVVLPVLSVSGVLSPSLVRTIEGDASLPALRVAGVIFNSTYSFSEDDAVLRYSSSRRLI